MIHLQCVYHDNYDLDGREDVYSHVDMFNAALKKYPNAKDVYISYLTMDVDSSKLLLFKPYFTPWSWIWFKDTHSFSREISIVKNAIAIAMAKMNKVLDK